MFAVNIGTFGQYFCITQYSFAAGFIKVDIPRNELFFWKNQIAVELLIPRS